MVKLVVELDVGRVQGAVVDRADDDGGIAHYGECAWRRWAAVSFEDEAPTLLLFAVVVEVADARKRAEVERVAGRSHDRQPTRARSVSYPS